MLNWATRRDNGNILGAWPVSQEANCLEVSHEGSVTFLTLAKAPSNTVDIPLMRALMQAVRAATRAPTRPRAIVLRSAIAQVFSHGIDPAVILKADLAGRLEVFKTLAELD